MAARSKSNRIEGFVFFFIYECLSRVEVTIKVNPNQIKINCLSNAFIFSFENPVETHHRFKLNK